MSINYIEKGLGLHLAIEAAGHWLRQVNGVWASSNDAVVQDIINSYTLASAKEARRREVSAVARTKFDAITSGISPAEMAGWSILLSEAEAFRGGKSSPPSVAAEAAIRGISVAALVAKVEANAAQFQAARAAIAGTDGKKRDQIDALTTFEAVAAYDVTAGWPL